MTRTMHSSLALGLVLAAVAPGQAPAPQANSELLKTFEELAQKVQREPDLVPEAEVQKLFDMGKQLGRPYPVSLAIKSYLSRNLNPPAAIRLRAAENALLAADYRTAVARYKAYLRAAQPGMEASQAVATMYWISIDLLGAEDDAYQFMVEHGERFRQSPAARKFDSWFLESARSRRDFPQWARWLTLVTADKLPIEMERLHYGEILDGLMQEISQAQPAHFETLPHARKLVSQIREDQLRTLRYGFYVENLAFQAGSVGKDPTSLAGAFEPVLKAARAYFGAFPTAGTVQDVFSLFVGGYGRFDGNVWNVQAEPKRALLQEAFAKLSDEHRKTLLDWTPHGQWFAGYLATPEQWVELGARHAALLRASQAVLVLPFVTRSNDPAVFQKQVQFLRDVPAKNAAIITAQSAGNDLAPCIDHLIQKESWLLEFTEPYSYIQSYLWPNFSSYPRDPKQPLPGDYHPRQMLRFGEQYVTKTPLGLFDLSAAQGYVTHTWRSAGKDGNDKSKVAAVLRSFDWMPYDAKQRQQVFEPAYNEFKQWAQQLRRQEKQTKDAKQLKELQAVLAQISPLEEAFQKSLAEGTFDPAKAPNPLCRGLAMAVRALQQGDQPAYLQAARQVYPLVKDFETQRTPLGWATLQFLVQNRPARREGASIEIIDLQCEILADQLARYSPSRSPMFLRQLVNVSFSRPRWGWFSVPAADKELALKLNTVFAKVLLDQVNKGQFWPELLYWMRGTRAGQGWNQNDRNLDVMAALIDKKSLLSVPPERRPLGPTWRSAAANYMYLIRNEFPSLGEKYPAERYFDDLFIEEATKTSYLDYYYWQYGRDEKKRIVNLAAQTFAAFDRLPFGYGTVPAAYSRQDFWNWQSQALAAEEPVRDPMLAKIEATYGKTRFDWYAMGRSYFSVTKADLKTPEGRKEYFGKLAAYLDRARDLPGRDLAPYLSKLSELPDPAPLEKEQVDVLVRLFHDAAPRLWTSGWYYQTLVQVVHRSLVAAQRQAELYALVPHFWKVARDCNDGTLYRNLVGYGSNLLEAKEHDLATVYSSAGLGLVGPLLAEDLRTNLSSIRSNALLGVGGIIPVPPSDPRYPLFAAQMAYLTGKIQNAWETYRANRARIGATFKELDPMFTIWIIERETESRDFAFAENVARQVLVWIDAAPSGFDAEVRGRLMYAYANIAFTRREYPRARALFERIAAATEFEGTLAQRDAELRIAEVDRLTKRYDLAEERLDRLARRNDKELQAEANYHLALIRFDQEEYPEAQEHLEQVFARIPDHAEARILEGRIQLEMKRLVQATDVKVGLATAQRLLVIGKPLKVGLEDRNLSVVGKATAIEIRAWTSSGDEELFSLVPYADSKTRFEGQRPTALGPVTKGDGVLQVLGKDTVYFDYSEPFKQSHRISGSQPHELQVATDAQLLVSSGRILTAEEREAQALERLIRQRLDIELDPRAQAALSTVRLENQIKPGGNIRIRVVDPDRGMTSKKDTVSVRLATTSGDRVAAAMLEETEEHSGIFEGSIPTATAQAIAYADDSDEGRDANHTISAGDHPAWVALPDNVRPKMFGIDLNQSVDLGKLEIRAGVPGRKLKSFQILTSPNGREFLPVGLWPDPLRPWDGSLSLEIVRADSKKYFPADFPFVRDHLAWGYLREGSPKEVMSPTNIAAKWDANVGGLADKLKLQGGGPQSYYVAHFEAAFVQASRRVRTFQVEPAAQRGDIRYFLAIDGELGKPPFREIQRPLDKGVHRIDLYVCAYRHASPQFELRCDVDKPPYLASCPPEMFDPAQHPEIRDAVHREPATVTADEKQERFDVQFPPGSKARVVKLVLADFETDAPAIEKIGLSNAAGQILLPTQQDFASLKSNGTLEIVPGDRISITYEDPIVVSPTSQTHEVFMTATYSNAELAACFVEYRQLPNGEREAEYIPMRRYKRGDKVTVFIKDPDGDDSDEMDTVVFGVQRKDGAPVQLKALETEPHSGIFLGTVWPVETAPQREGEITVGPQDDLALFYFDRENTDPGIPWERRVMVEPVLDTPPQLRVYGVTSVPLSEEEMKAASGTGADRTRLYDEWVPVRRTLVASRPEEPDESTPTAILVGGPLLVELQYPAVAQSPKSQATVFVQTASGRQRFGKPIAPGEFDLNVPGTIKLIATPSDPPRLEPPLGYKEVVVRGNPYAGDPIDDGRFTFHVPLELGDVPEETFAFLEPPPEGTPRLPEDEPVLAHRGNDEIFVGFRFTDAAGREQWLIKKIVLASDVFFDVTDRRFQEPVTGIHVGDSIYFRVLEGTRDVSDEKDEVPIELRTSSGRSQTLSLTETFGHSGSFKGLVKLIYDQGTAGASEEPGILAVRYGDVVTATYRPGGGDPMGREVLVFKGADGQVVPFTKRFKDPAIAVQTQFTIAEAYFELAKRHRELGQTDLSRREIAQGKKLLEEAIRDYPDSEARAQADYLLSNLALEFANDAVNEEVKKKFYMEAIARFSDLVASYPDSPYAPKSQFKKGLVFERMGQIDQAAEEYVKLSYRYPENELVAETIARLGQYFLTKGKNFDAQAEAQADVVEREKVKIQGRDMFKTAGQVFGRLAVRFPSHNLAGKTTVLSAQCFMRADDLRKAIEVFGTVVENKEAPKDLVSESMYWKADCYYRQRDFVNAYRSFKKLTWDYPESQWAKYARGRLTEESLVAVEEREAAMSGNN